MSRQKRNGTSSAKLTGLAAAKREIERRLKQGQGTGEGKTYRPWLLNYQYSSRGNKRVIWSNTLQRNVHLASDLEYGVYQAVMRQSEPKLKHLKEQYPLLPIEETIEIANEQRVKHPRIPRTDIPHLMTTDLVVYRDLNPGTFIQPICVKPQSLTDDRRIGEKIAIEREYWRRRSLTMIVATETFVSKTDLLNFQWFRDEWAVSHIPPATLKKVRGKLITAFSEARPLIDGLSVIEAELSLERPLTLEAARYLFSTIDFDTEDGLPICRSNKIIIQGY